MVQGGFTSRVFVALPAADRGRRSYQQSKRSLRFPEAIIGACKCKGRTEAALNGAAPASEEHTLQRTGTRTKRLGKVEGGRVNANSRMSMFPRTGSLLPHNDRRTRGPASTVFQGLYPGPVLKWVQTRKTVAKSSVTHTISPANSIPDRLTSCLASQALSTTLSMTEPLPPKSPLLQQMLTMENNILLVRLLLAEE